MTLAATIYNLMTEHGKLTRKQIAKMTGAKEKTVESATRKLEDQRIMIRTGELFENAVVFALSDGYHDLMSGKKSAGRPKDVQHEPCISLSAVMNAFFGRAS
jgi:hypothetical protein